MLIQKILFFCFSIYVLYLKSDPFKTFLEFVKGEVYVREVSPACADYLP
jgi:hypothetical protein